MILIRLSYYLRLLLLFSFCLLLLLPPLPYSPLSTVSPVSADAEGWYLEGQPVFKPDYTDLPPCYINRKITVSNGMITGQETLTGGACFKNPGTNTGQFTWNPPPAYLAPNSKITFTATATGCCGGLKTTGGNIKANNKTVLEIASWTPQSQTAEYTVPAGKAGNKLELYVAVGSCGGHGYVTYNYVYKGAGTTTTPATQPAPATTSPSTQPVLTYTDDGAPGPLTDKLPKLASKDIFYYIYRVDNNPIYVSADPSTVPASERTWVKFTPGLYWKEKSIRIGKDWTIRTTAGAETLMVAKNPLIVRTQGSWIKLRKASMLQDTGKLVEGWGQNERLDNTGKDWYVQTLSSSETVLVIKDTPGQQTDPIKKPVKGYSPQDLERDMKTAQHNDRCRFFLGDSALSVRKYDTALPDGTKVLPVTQPEGFKGTDRYDIETNLSFAEINGTDFVFEVNEQGDTYKVIGGEVTVTQKASGAKVTLTQGKQVTATTTSLSNVSSFGIADEAGSWTTYQEINSAVAQDIKSSSSSSGQSSDTKKKIKIGPLSCFIATAAYGSETAAELDTLRSFRDRVLMQSEPGRWFVDTYYTVSPPLANFIAEHEEVRTLVREVLLDPVVTILKGSQEVWNH